MADGQEENDTEDDAGKGTEEEDNGVHRGEGQDGDGEDGEGRAVRAKR